MPWSEPPPELDTPRAAHLRAMRDQYGVDSPEAKEAFDARLAEVFAEEAADPQVRLWMLSFVDPSKSAPPGEQVPGEGGWLGTCVVTAFGMVDAVTRAHELEINPGGEVAGYGPLPLDSIAAEWHNRLLTKDEVLSIPEPEGWGR